MYLIFDTETTGLPKKWKAPITDTDNWPRCVQIAWQLHDKYGQLIENQDYLIIPEDYNIPYDAEQIHGISTQLAAEKGKSLAEVLTLFNEALAKTTFIVGQNLNFDLNIMGCEYHRKGVETLLNELPVLDTCTEKTATLCQLPGGRYGKFKLPTLTELHQKLFNQPFSEAHNATADVEATTRCFLELIRINNYTISELKQPENFLVDFKEKNPTTIDKIGLKHVNLKEASKRLKERQKKETKEEQQDSKTEDRNLKTNDLNFSHLHNHSQFSILQSTSSTSDLISNAVKQGMNAVALTDYGNMMGSFYFVKDALAHNKKVKEHNEKLAEDEIPLKPITPILGSAFNVCENHLDKKNKDNGYQVVFLAKNKNGYHNLCKLSSISHTRGFYYVPRIDRNLIEEFKEDLIVISGNLYGEIPSKILNIGEKQAEESLVWWKNTFKTDFYLELMRHGQENEDHVNDVLLQFAKKHEVKVIATNNTFYINKDNADSHDIMLCIKDAEQQATPKGRGRGYRYGLDNEEYYFKSQDEMIELFHDIPEAISNIQEIVDKVETYALARDVLLPKFSIPNEFEVEEDLQDKGVRGENKYLKHLTFEGARERYGDVLDEETQERLDFELMIIEKTGYPGYFLIVWDLIKAARDMEVSVGPGRGSAAGSVVAYCLQITNIDPLKYNLLFERFLNPDRVSLPDIDIDFDDEGRGLVLQYVIDKYGANQVAQIITYGTMAAKSSLRDTARVLDLPLYEADRIAKLIPLIKLKAIFGDDPKSIGKVKALRSEDKDKVEEFKTLAEGDTLISQTILQARALEGSVRNTGTHACGVIITPEDITNLVPVSTAKDSEMFVTQFDNNVVESAGLLKMDFLGLKTLTLIKDAVKIVKAIHDVDLIPDDFPLDDKKTYELFQRGETVGIFQYESAGMQKHLRGLKPTEFEDLIAMNALYRPGPMEYIPSFIDRKHGREDIAYDLPEMEEYLKETYGITVYQEQVMLLSQKLANFTKGEADGLRKAMGKKIFALLAKMKPMFLERGNANGHKTETLEKIWKDWEAFAAYAFNKSHSTCYAYIAYQTAYLKAHYPAEYMASVLSNNMRDIKSVTFFMEECKRMGIEVLGPDVNESFYKFAVNKTGAIRFGIGAIKGMGEKAVDAITKERKENGHYKSIFDMAKRVDLRAASKKAFDGLAISGGFDSFGDINRSQYYAEDEKGQTIIDKAIRFGNKYQENKNSAQVSLFGETSNVQFEEPIIPICAPWNIMEKLSKEKQAIGIYISGHPLDDYKTEMKYFCNGNLNVFADLENIVGKDVTFAGIISSVQHRVSKNGKGWASFFVEDFNESYEFRIFSEDYLKMRHFLIPNSFLHIKANIQRGWNDGPPRIKFTQMQQLQDVLSKTAKKITLQLDVNSLTENAIRKIDNLLRLHAGSHILNFVVYDASEKLKLHMQSRTKKVNISNELLKELENEKVSYRLN